MLGFKIIYNMKFTISTKGRGDVIDITAKVAKEAQLSGVDDGLAVVFVPGSTAAITTIEYEPGVINDLKKVLEKIAPAGLNYEHHKRWGDNNGDAHIKSALIGPSLSVLIENSRLVLGSWQQIVLIDFDEKPREREIIVSVFKCI